MADKVKRWAVREDNGTGYLVFVGPKPSKPKHGWYWERVKRKHEWLCKKEYEWFLPKCYHLKPGGGPVEIRFADEA